MVYWILMRIRIQPTKINADPCVSGSEILLSSNKFIKVGIRKKVGRYLLCKTFNLGNISGQCLFTHVWRGDYLCPMWLHVLLMNLPSQLNMYLPNFSQNQIFPTNLTNSMLHSLVYV